MRTSNTDSTFIKLKINCFQLKKRSEVKNEPCDNHILTMIDQVHFVDIMLSSFNFLFIIINYTMNKNNRKTAECEVEHCKCTFGDTRFSFICWRKCFLIACDFLFVQDEIIKSKHGSIEAFTESFSCSI